MSQRHSEYARMEDDCYITPRWVWEALYDVEPWAESAFECAPVNYKCDFFSLPLINPDLATNPPFRLAEEFCRRAIEIGVRVAMLLPHTFDTAKGRVDLWKPPFKAKYVLTKRIRWENLEQKKAGPSSNHAWYVWDKTWGGLPFMGWI